VVCVLALVAAAHAQSAESVDYKAVAAEYLASAQEAAVKYGAQAQGIAKDYYEKGSAYVQELVDKFSKKDGASVGGGGVGWGVCVGGAWG